MKLFRGGLAFKAHRLLYHSTLGLRVIKKKKKQGELKVFRGGDNRRGQGVHPGRESPQIGPPHQQRANPGLGPTLNFLTRSLARSRCNWGQTSLSRPNSGLGGVLLQAKVFQTFKLFPLCSEADRTMPTVEYPDFAFWGSDGWQHSASHARALILSHRECLSFCRSQFPHKSVNLSFIITNIY